MPCCHFCPRSHFNPTALSLLYCRFVYLILGILLVHHFDRVSTLPSSNGPLSYTSLQFLSLGFFIFLEHGHDLDCPDWLLRCWPFPQSSWKYLHCHHYQPSYLQTNFPQNCLLPLNSLPLTFSGNACISFSSSLVTSKSPTDKIMFLRCYQKSKVGLQLFQGNWIFPGITGHQAASAFIPYSQLFSGFSPTPYTDHKTIQLWTPGSQSNWRYWRKRSHSFHHLCIWNTSGRCQVQKTWVRNGSWKAWSLVWSQSDLQHKRRTHQFCWRNVCRWFFDLIFGIRNCKGPQKHSDWELPWRVRE